MFTGKLIELSGRHGIHLAESDAAIAPLLVRFVDGEKGIEEQTDNAFGDRLGINGEARQQVVHVAHIPKLCSGKEMENKKSQLKV